jgi:hypothetical protein
MSYANLTGGVVMQTVSEFLDSFLKPKTKKGIKKRYFRTCVPSIVNVLSGSGEFGGYS